MSEFWSIELWSKFKDNSNGVCFCNSKKSNIKIKNIYNEKMTTEGFEPSPEDWCLKPAP